MKKAILFALAGLASAVPALAETNAEYIARKVSVGYVDNPNTPAPIDVITPEAVIAGTGTSQFFTRPECAPLREMANAMFKPGTTDGVNHATFQRYLANIIRLQDRPILIMLINDNAAPIANGLSVNNAWINGNGHVWPHASRWNPPVAVGGGSYGGYFTFGNYELLHNPQFSQSANRLGVFLHEMTHTQDTAQWRAHMYGPYSYGTGGHYTVEVVPDPSAAYSEAIANFMHMLVDRREVRDHFNWFTDPNAIILVDRRPRGDTPAPTTDEAGRTVRTSTARRVSFRLIEDLRRLGINPLTSAPAGYSAEAFTRLNRTSAFYRLRDLPASVVARNEEIFALVIYYTNFTIGFDRMIQVYRRAIRSTDETSSPVFGNFVHFMAETANGGPLTGTPSSTTPVRGFLPLALFDYFTRFAATDATSYKRALEFSDGPDDWVDTYFSSGIRARVRAAINLDSLSGGDIERIRAALNLPN